MKILGIIAEYNPFHNGHLYHIEKSKELTGADAVIAVMSGNFVQRGEPAIVDKWARAEMAVRNGVDLVFELPFAYAVNSADNFAKGGVKLFDSLGCVDFISFGSEDGNLEMIDNAAGIMAAETDVLKELIRRGLENGDSYAKARGDAIAAIISEDNLSIKRPNNILAIEYLKNLKLLNSKIKPVTIKREGQDYNCSEIDKGNNVNLLNFASATSIRNEIHENNDLTSVINLVPSETIDVLNNINNNVNIKLNDFYNIIRYEILNRSETELADIFAITEGLENRLKNAVRTSDDIESLIDNIISKRYTRTRIRRVLIQTLTGFTKTDFDVIDTQDSLYARVLGFSEKGAEILKSLKKSSECSIPIITNINKDYLKTDAQNLLMKYDFKATDIYNLICGRSIYDYSDYVRKPFINK